MATPLVVRKITDGDVADVLSINNTNTPAVGFVDMDQLQFLIQHSQHALVVADDTVKVFASRSGTAPRTRAQTTCGFLVGTAISSI